MVPGFKNVGERSKAKSYWPVILLSVVSKFFEKLVNSRIADHLRKCDLFSDFQYGFRPSQWTRDFIAVALTELLGILKSLWLLKLYYLIYPRLLTRFDMLVFFTDLRLMEFWVTFLAFFILFLVIDSFVLFCRVGR